MAERISIIIVDDHKMIANALGSQLDNVEGLNVLDVITDPQNLKEMVIEKHPNVLLMDIRLGKYNGIELAGEVRNSNPNIRIILMSGYKVGNISNSIGVDGFVSKEESIESLASTIKKIFYEKVCIFPQNNSYNLLTDSELKILELISEDLTRKEIAERLYISEKTVTNHISSILEKLNVRSRIGAVVKGIELGFIAPKK
ncbi:MAG: response regulator transcription factor [Lachnospiraceae bacterium]|nr:response regulator transcription factor [Lachnospiraceae bacterium]